MERMFIPMFIQIAVVPFHAFWCHIFITDYGIKGCAIAANISDTLAFVLIFLYIKFQSDRVVQESWITFSKDNFINFREYA